MPVPRWSVVACWLLGLAPAVVLPGALTPYVFPKLAVTTAGVACAFVGPTTCRLPRRVAATLGAGVLVLVVAALAGASPLGQLIGRAPRYEGLVSVGVYVACVVAGARLLSAPSGARTHLLRACAVAGALAAVVALGETAGLLDATSDASRPGTLLGNATEQGAYGVVLLALALGVARDARRRRDPWLVVLGAAGAVLLVTSASRGALLGLGPALVVLVLAAVGRWRRTVLAGAGAAALAVAVLALALPLTRDRLLLRSPLSRQTITGRWAEWHDVLQLVAHHPWLGLGPSGFVDALPGVQSAAYVRLAGPDRLDSPHALPLQVAAAGGVLLLAVSLVAAGLLVRAVLRRRADDATWSTAAAAAVTGWASVLCTHFTAPGTTPYVLVLVGGLLAEPARRDLAPALRRGLAGLVAAAAVVLVAAAVAEVPLRQGLVDLQSGRPQAALDAFGTARAWRPWDADLDATVAHALVVQPPGTPAARRLTDEVVARALARFPGDPDVLVDAGQAASQAGRGPQALVALDEAVRLAPVDVEAREVRARLRAGAGDLAGAVGDLRVATDLAPTDATAWRLLASAYAQQGQDAAAREAAARAAALPR